MAWGLRSAGRTATAILLVLGCSLLTGARAQLGPWTGGGGGGGGGGPNFDDFGSVVDYVDKFVNMTPWQQQAILVTAGLALQTRTGMDCNIFGGHLACRPLPTDSSYLQQCGSDAQAKVDCLFKETTEANVYDSPVDNLEAYLKQKVAQQAQSAPAMAQRFGDVPALCPQCFDRLQALWCALAVPGCGTFDLLVNRGILPALAQAVRAYRSSSSSTRAEAVAGAVAAAVHVAGVGLPCAEMCEAVLDTCGGHCEHAMMTGGGQVRQATLGALVTWMASRPEIQRIGRMPDLKNARALFRDLWDRPLCSLFPKGSGAGAGSAISGSTGACRLPTGPSQSQCQSQKEWCEATSMASMAGDDHPIMYIQALILVQLLRASTGWLTSDDAIIWDIHSSVSDVVAGGGSSSNQYDAMMSGSKGVSGSQVAGFVVLGLFGFALLSAGVAMVGLRWWRGRSKQQVFYHELSDQDGDLYPLNNPRDRL